ncbi:protein kinase [Haematococcus lacustris]|uniref:Protein kinase n=1 Tax=Haematococcus lacustris TaxID=44745 RepID=A0A699YGE7_HAELA|nr:protein kinase [Haematococcus lacustris]
MTPASNRLDKEDQGVFLSAHELHVVRLLGQGAYASVYLASRHDGSTVAVKVLHDVHRQTGCTAQKLFVREALLMNKITHMSILKAHGLYRISGSHPGLQGPRREPGTVACTADEGSLEAVVQSCPGGYACSSATPLTTARTIWWEGSKGEPRGYSPPLMHARRRGRCVAHLVHLVLYTCKQLEQLPYSTCQSVVCGSVSHQPNLSAAMEPGTPDGCQTCQLMTALLACRPASGTYVVDRHRRRLAAPAQSHPPGGTPRHQADLGLHVVLGQQRRSLRVSSRSLLQAGLPALPPNQPQQSRFALKPCRQPASTQVSRPASPGLPDACAVSDAACQLSPLPSRQHSFILDAPTLQHILMSKGDHPFAASHSTSTAANLLTTFEVPSTSSVSGTSGTNPGHWSQASSVLHSSLPDCSAVAEASVDKPPPASDSCSTLDSTVLQQLGRWGDDSAWQAMLAYIDTQPLSRKDWQWVYSLTGQTGSAVYMAPEVHRGEPYNTSADVHSFGILAYELLARSMLVFSHIGTATLPGVTTADCWHLDPNTRPSMAALLPRLQQALQARLAAGEERGQMGQGGKGSGLGWERREG